MTTRRTPPGRPPCMVLSLLARHNRRLDCSWIHAKGDGGPTWAEPAGPPCRGLAGAGWTGRVEATTPAAHGDRGRQRHDLAGFAPVAQPPDTNAAGGRVRLPVTQLLGG